MPTRNSGLSAGALILLALLPGSGLPSPAPQEQPIVRITVALVQIDAVVTDSHGRHIPDLKPEDFELRQDGKLQKITHFAYVSAPAPEATNPAVAAGTKPPDKMAPPRPASVLKPADIKRMAALVVDDLGLSFESMACMRDALREYVDKKMQPGDLLAILPTGGGMGALQQFTTDKRVLYAAINALRWNPRGRISFFDPIDSSQSEEETAALQRERDFLEESFSVGALASIAQAVQGVHTLPGRKSVVVFSENLRIQQSGETNPRLLDDLQRLTDLANRAGVVIYTIDPRGLPTLGFTAADRFSPNVAPGEDPTTQLRQMQDTRRNNYYDSQAGLSYLADQTGGLFMSNSNDIAGSLKEVMEDQTGYYLLGYVPQEGTFAKDFRDSKFQRVSIKVLRSGLRVRSRAGFINVTDTASVPAPRTRESQIRTALMSPFSAAEVRVRLTSLFKDSLKQGPYVQSLLHIDAQDLTFSDEADDWHKSVVEIVTMTAHGQNEAGERRDRSYTLRVKGESYRLALQQGFICSVIQPVTKAGAFQMRALVRDVASKRIGTASQFIEVPDIKKSRLAVSGIVLQAAPPEFQQPGPSADPGKGQPSEKAGQVEAYSEGHPAVRRYYQGQTLLYGFQAINGRVDSKTRRSQLESQVRLFRNGKLIYSAPPRPMPEQGQVDARHVLGAGLLRLGSVMVPGEYVLQVIVTDKLARDKYAKAGQWIDLLVLTDPRAVPTPDEKKKPRQTPRFLEFGTGMSAPLLLSTATSW